MESIHAVDGERPFTDLFRLASFGHGLILVDRIYTQHATKRIEPIYIDTCEPVSLQFVVDPQRSNDLSRGL